MKSTKNQESTKQKSMGIGLIAYGNRLEEILPISQHADALGFECVWLGDHIVLPENMSVQHPNERLRYMVNSGDEWLYDIWVMVGAVIAATKHIKVGTGIYVLPMRQPLLTARACLSAQALAGGRFRFGVGAGWSNDEFDALGANFKDRAKNYDEILDILSRIFAGTGPVEHAGPSFPFRPLQMTKEPVKIPLIFGGSKPPAIRRAALRGDGWYSTQIPLEESVALMRNIERIRADNGLDKKPFEFIGKILRESSLNNLDDYREAGFDHVSLPWHAVHAADSPDLSLGAKLKSLEKVARKLSLKAR